MNDLTKEQRIAIAREELTALFKTNLTAERSLANFERIYSTIISAGSGVKAYGTMLGDISEDLTSSEAGGGLHVLGSAVNRNSESLYSIAKLISEYLKEES